MGSIVHLWRRCAQSQVAGFLKLAPLRSRLTPWLEGRHNASMDMSRRGFVGGVAGLMASVAAGRAASPGVGDDPVIDAHIHIWDLQTLNPPWLANAPQVLRQKYMAAEYRNATEGLNVAKAVYVEIAESPQRQPTEAEFILEQIRSGRTSIVAAVIGGDPAAGSFAGHIRRFAQSTQIKGVRCSLRNGAAGDKKFFSGVHLLGELGLSFDLVLAADLLDEAARLVAASPKTLFILDHCGSGNTAWYDHAGDQRCRAWEKGITALAQHENVACKISGVAEQSQGEPTVERLRPVVEHCLTSFGDDRVMFASNWPVCLRTISLADWLRRVRQIVAPRGKALARKLFHDNAVRWYRLDR